MASAPVFRDLPASSALEAWYSACAAAGCPRSRWTPSGWGSPKPSGWSQPSPYGRCGRRPPSRRRPWTASRCGGPTRQERARALRLCLLPTPSRSSTPATRFLERFDSVVMREHVAYVAGGAELRSAAVPYQHVRPIGEDIGATELLLPQGHRLRAVDVAACGAAGLTELLVRRRPVVAVIPTGDEMRPIGTDIVAGELHDTNSLMLAAQAARDRLRSRGAPHRGRRP